MRLIGLTLVLVGALVSMAAQAKMAITDAELARLPQFCTAKLKNTSEVGLWAQRLGPDFGHTHHYCYGLHELNLYFQSRTARDKKFHLKNAEGNFTYMATHAEETYSLMPEVYLNRGITFSLMKRDAEAVSDMNKALELNPNLVKAYNYLADYYAGINLKAKALQIITEGLRHNPGTNSLQRRYSELGGKLPYPEPVKPAPAETAQPAIPEAVLPPVQAEMADKPAPATAAPPPDTPSESKIGSPKNPYCRFCPD
jgi:tetratricopeptide (TPR) repeat protein